MRYTINQDLIDSNLNATLEKWDNATREIQQDDNFLNKLYPNGYEAIDLPIEKVAEKCEKCNARLIRLIRAVKDKNSKNTTLFCCCTTCLSSYILVNHENKIHKIIKKD